MGLFGFLSERPSLVGSYGVTVRDEVASALLEAQDPEDVFELEHRLGAVRFDQDRRDRLVEFVRRFVAGYNDRGGQRGWWSSLSL